jgi:hypothetical protein
METAKELLTIAAPPTDGKFPDSLEEIAPMHLAWRALSKREPARIPNPRGEHEMNFTVVQIGPLVALIAGILILIMPRLLNFIVAIYLIIIGVLGLAAHF